jgi:hypothetical protein
MIDLPDGLAIWYKAKDAVVGERLIIAHRSAPVPMR